MSSAWLTPLTQRTHLITIILVTVLFAFFRLSGGGISIRENGSKPATLKESKEASRASKTMPAAQGSGSKGSAGQDSDDEFLRSLSGELGPVRVAPEEEQEKEPDLMNEILGRETLPASERAKREREVRQKNSEGLEDVKKMLGLP